MPSTWPGKRSSGANRFSIGAASQLPMGKVASVNRTAVVAATIVVAARVRPRRYSTIATTNSKRQRFAGENTSQSTLEST